MSIDLTAEQIEQRAILIRLGHTSYMVDAMFDPSEWGMLIQETLLDTLDDEGDDDDE